MIQLSALSTRGKSLTKGFVNQLQTFMEDSSLDFHFIEFESSREQLHAPFLFFGWRRTSMRPSDLSSVWEVREAEAQCLTCTCLDKEKENQHAGLPAHTRLCAHYSAFGQLCWGTTGGKGAVSALLRVLNIVYSLFGIGTSASRDQPLSNYSLPFPTCSLLCLLYKKC